MLTWHMAMDGNGVQCNKSPCCLIVSPGASEMPGAATHRHLVRVDDPSVLSESTVLSRFGDWSCAFCRGILVSHVGITCVSRKFLTTSWMIQGFSNLLQFGDCRTPELITRQSGPPLSPSKWIYTTTGFHQTHPFYKDTHYYWLHYFAWVHRLCYVTMCNGFVTVFTILFSIRASHIVFTFSYLSGWSLRPTLALCVMLPHGVVFLTMMVVGAACCTGSSSIASRNASFSHGSCLFTSSLM